MLDDITRNRHGGNPESEAANKKIHHRKPVIRTEVFDYVQR